LFSVFGGEEVRSDERGVGRDDVSLVVRERNVTAAADVVPVTLLSENEFKFVEMSETWKMKGFNGEKQRFNAF
jgi:hypothetical protein